MVKEINTSVKFNLKEAKEYYKYLGTLTDTGLMAEWAKVTNELKNIFGIPEVKKPRNSSISLQF